MDTSVRVADPSDLDVVVDVLTKAFLDDPVMSWAFDEPVRGARLNGQWRLLAGAGYLPVGASTLLPGGDGAALWMPPDHHLGGEFWTEHGAAFQEALDGDTERISALGAEMATQHPHDPHWYLLAVGVHPDGQGRGLGGALLAHTLVTADERGEPAYLEASSLRSRVLYERFGFEVISEFRAGDSPPLWGMWREPRTTGK